MKVILSLILMALTIWPGILYSQKVTTPGVYVQEVPSGIKAIRSVATDIPIFIGYTQKAPKATSRSGVPAVLIKSYAAYQRSFGGPVAGYLLCESIQLFFENGGRQCYVLSVGRSSQPIQRKALTLGLSRSRKIKAQLVAIPDAVQLPQADFYALQNEMLRHCARAKDRFAILNTREPGPNAMQDFQAFRAGISGSHLAWGAVYYPWLLTTAGTTVPPSGAIAGVYAQTDGAEGVWKAPANVGLNGIGSVSTTLSRGEQQAANVSTSDGKSINAIVPFSGKGILVWGARTLAGNDNEWRYVPVRRLAILIEQSLKAGLGWVVFEGNDEPLWTNMKAVASNYMLGLWREGALAGAKPEQAFFVKCGLGETMTAADISAGKLILELGFAPLKPAEFVILRMEWKMR